MENRTLISGATEPDRQPLATARRRWRIVVLAIYWSALFVATHRSPAQGGVFDIYVAALDKLVHFLAYVILGWLFAWASQLRPTLDNWRATIGLWLLVVTYGAFDEVTQLLVGRSCHLYDWLADIAGATVGIWMYVRRCQT